MPQTLGFQKFIMVVSSTVSLLWLENDRTKNLLAMDISSHADQNWLDIWFSWSVLQKQSNFFD